ncbi:MAG: acetoin utilization protein AcuC [Burkholderiales bacterium]|nr:acetoin utilization protein AcuC [Burkholderiales bacterium]
MSKVCLYVSDVLGAYGFPGGHPFGTDRQQAFWRETVRQGLDRKVSLCEGGIATRTELERFHTPRYLDRVRMLSDTGLGFIDGGDTPAFVGVYEAAAAVVGAALAGLARVMTNGANEANDAHDCARTFQPIGGLHHARRDAAAGFCVFNDIGIVIETLRAQHRVKRIAYIDIDVHHGDGVFYSYQDDPDLIFADIHEDGHYLYPGTGGADETGRGKAKGTKLNIPLRPGAGDKEFFAAWEKAEALLTKYKPEFFLFQCGADSLAGDPLAHLNYSEATHAHAARRLRILADRYAGGRIMGFGGGGYNRKNIAEAWNAVLAEFITTSA